MKLGKLIIAFLFLQVSSVNAINSYSRIDMPMGNRDESGGIRAICQDYLGYIWIGQNNGLYCFDGYTYKKIPSVSESEFGISNNSISCIFEDSDSLLWIATRGGGLNLYNRKTDSFTFYTNENSNSQSISFNDISCIYEDPYNNIWIGTDGGGLNKLNKDDFSFTRIVDDNNKENSSKGKVLSIFSGAENELYIGTWGDGLKKVNLKTGSWESLFENLNHYPANSRRNVWDIKSYSEHELLLGTFGEGALIFNTNTRDLERLKGLSGKNVFSCQKAKDGAWLFSSDFGLESLVEKRVNTIDANGIIYSFCFDRDDNLWIGQKQELWILKNTTSHFNTSKYLEAQNYSAMFLENTEDLWLENTGELFRVNLREHETSRWKIPGKGVVNQISAWSADTVMIARADELLFFDSENEKFANAGSGSTEFEAIKNGNIFFVGNTVDSATWIGLLGTLYFKKHNKEKVLSENNLPGLSMSHYVSRVLADTDGTYWLGTYGGGLNHLNKAMTEVKAFKQNFTSVNEISNNFIECLAWDNKNRLWIGTHDGLNVLEEPHLGKFKTYTTNNGLPNNKINCMVFDSDGILWLGTNNGLCRVDVHKIEFRAFNTSDGLPSTHFIINAAALLENGDILMATANGLIQFSPRLLEMKKEIPEIYIQSFRLFNNEIHPGEASVLTENISSTKSIQLKYNQNYFGFDFTSLIWFNPENVSYLVQLQGLDDEWQQTKLNTVDYRNVPPGKYVLKVKAMLAGSYSKEKSIQIVVVPPWWKSTVAYWAYGLLCIAFVIAGIFLMISRERKRASEKLQKYKHRKQREINDLKIAFFSQVSNELKNPLTLIVNPLEELIASADVSNCKEQISRIQSGTIQMKQLLDRLVDFKKIGTGEEQPNFVLGNLSSLLHKLCGNYKARARRGGIDFQYKIVPDNLLVQFDNSVLRKITSNVLDFFITRSPKDSVLVFQSSVFIENGKDYLLIEVSDSNGELGAGEIPYILEPFRSKNIDIQYDFGMAITVELLKLHKGEISLQNHMGGLLAKLKLPLQNGTKNVNVTEKVSEDLQNESLPGLYLVIKHQELSEYLVESFRGNYRVMSFTNAEEVMKVSMKDELEFIICDYDLPGIDGLQFYRGLIKDKRIDKIPFILLHGEENPTLKIEALQLGVYSFVVKPFRIEELEAKVRNYFVARESLKAELTSDSQSIQIRDVEISDTQKELLDKLLAFMEKNFMEPTLKVDALCSYMNISRPQLYRKLQTLTGLSVQEFIKSFRLKKAASLLRTGSLRISDVAYRTGFSDPQHFSKSFKSQFGISPSQYAAKNKS